MVAAIAAESVVKLLAFLAVGAFVTWGLFAGPGDLFARAMAQPRSRPLLHAGAAHPFAYDAVVRAHAAGDAVSVILLPRQFQVMVVENVDERHLKRAAWAFPAYLLSINLFVLPIALRRPAVLRPGPARRRRSCLGPETFVLSLPLAAGAPALALVGLHRRPVGGHRHGHRRGHRRLDHGLQRPRAAGPAALEVLRAIGQGGDLTGMLLGIRRAVIVAAAAAGLAVLPHRRRGLCAGQHRPHQLCRGGAVCAGAAGRHVLEGRHAQRRAGRAGGRRGAVGLHADAAVHRQVGWMDAGFLQHGAFGIALLKPEALVRPGAGWTA